MRGYANRFGWTGKVWTTDERLVGRVLLWAVASAFFVLVFLGASSCPNVQVCGDVKGVRVCVDVDAQAGNNPVKLASTSVVESLSSKRWCEKGSGRFVVAVSPDTATNVTFHGRRLQECAPGKPAPRERETLTIERIDSTCSSEDPACLWPAPKPRTEASCYDPWIGRCHPWEEAVRLGIMPPDAPFATIALHDPRLAPCWRSAVGRAPSDPGQLAGRVTGTCGAEWESWWLTQGLPALAAAGRTGFCGSRGEALMATWECPDKCEARVLAEPGGAGLTPEHRTILRAADFPAFPVGDSVQVATWGCPWFVTVEGATPPPPPPPPPPSDPCPTGQACRPEPVCEPCPKLPADCPTSEAIGREIASATAEFRVKQAELLRGIFDACSAPAPACPTCPSFTVPVAEIAAATSEAMRLHTDALLGQISLLQRALDELKAVCKPGTKPPPDPTPDDPVSPPPGVFRFEATPSALTFREKLSGPGTARQVVLRAAFTPSTKLASGQHAQVLWLTTGKHKGGTLLALVCTGRGDCRIWQNLTPEKTQSKNVAMPLLPGVTYQILATYDTVAGRLGVGISGGGKATGLEVEAVKVPISFELLEVMGSSSVAGDLRWPAGSKWEVAVEIKP